MYNKILIVVLVIVSIVFLITYIEPLTQCKKEGFNAKKNYLDGVDVIYWINLDRSTDRRQRMEAMFQDPVFAGIPIIRIKAVDGKASNIDTILNANFEGMQPDKFTKVEYACTLSHLNTIKIFSESKYKTALIMEDDMTLELKPYWKKSVKQILNNAPSDWEIIQLCYIVFNTKPKNLYTKNTGNYYSNGAYIINQNGAKKMLNYSNKHILNQLIKHTADDYLINSLITYIYKYPMFIYGYNEQSTIHQDHINGHDLSKKNILKNIFKI
jgi:GR25 family glycosyltransferase involved in LPS biosynthesis